jgi:hypothetical protein
LKKNNPHLNTFELLNKLITMKYKITTGKYKGEVLELEEVKTITENGLEWGLHAEKEMTWPEAMDYVKSLGDGWRLPTIKELVAITDYSKINSVTHLGFAPDRYYWSSAEYTGYKDFAYYWDTNDGSVGYDSKGSKLSVQAVR